MIFGTKLLHSIRRRRLIACTALAVLCAVTILQSDLSPDLYFIHWGPLENISCHYIDSDDTLPRADSELFLPPSRSIFFHETSCKGDLNSRQACAIESAARTHPMWQINVIFTAPVTRYALKTGSLSELRNYSNVKLLRVHVAKYAKHTPLESMVSGGALNRTRWRISHTSDVLRYLTLYKFGGVYLDLDVVVAKALDPLVRNWAARESDTAVAAGALAFSRDEVGRRVAEAAIRSPPKLVTLTNVEPDIITSLPPDNTLSPSLRTDYGTDFNNINNNSPLSNLWEQKDVDIKIKYRGDVWGNNGPGVITRILKRQCSTAKPSQMSAATCNGFEVYGPRFFYPVEWWHGAEYFHPGEIKEEDTAYVFHVWNKRTSHLKVHKDSPYAKLARKYCPKIYKLYDVDFGL